MRGSPERRRIAPVMSESLDDFLIPGVVIELDPDEADRLGAFEENALTPDDAWGANLDP
jgi:hypothetical protein